MIISNHVPNVIQKYSMPQHELKLKCDSKITSTIMNSKGYSSKFWSTQHE